MGTIQSQFSFSPMFDKFGVITGSASVIQMLDEPCEMVRFKSHPSNIGMFFVGEAGSGYAPFPIDAGDDTGWVGTSNLNRYVHSNVSGSVDFLYYWLQK